MTRANTVTWLALLALTSIGYLASDRLGAAILALAAIKSGLVGFRFMGLGASHVALRTAFAVLIGAIVVALYVAQRA